MYALCLDNDSKVILACDEAYAPTDWPRVETIPSGDVRNYKYVNGEFVSDPLPEPTEPLVDISALDAQVTYTALMTDTLIEEA